jgi:hypothetical protein
MPSKCRLLRDFLRELHNLIRLAKIVVIDLLGAISVVGLLLWAVWKELHGLFQ